MTSSAVILDRMLQKIIFVLIEHVKGQDPASAKNSFPQFPNSENKMSRQQLMLRQLSKCAHLSSQHTGKR